MKKCPMPECEWENDDQAKVCGGCGVYLTPVAQGASQQPDAGVPSPGRKWTREAASHKLKTLRLAIACTTATFAFFLLAGLVWPRAFQIVFQRGWVPLVVVVLFGWSMAILWSKHRLRRNRKELTLSQLLADHPRIVRSEADGVLNKIEDHCRQQTIDPGDHPLTRRLGRALEAFKAQGRVEAASDSLQHTSDLDASAIDGSFNLVRVFIWAIPILGFIGTVMGIGDAVQGFSSFIQGVDDVSRLRQDLTPALGGVSSGLAVAFDTTLLALLLSIPTMVLASSSQKREEELLNKVDADSVFLLDRLEERDAAAVQENPQAVFMTFAEHARELLAKSLTEESQKISAVVDAGLARYERILNGLVQGPIETLSERLERVEETTEAVGNVLDSSLGRSEEVQLRLLESQRETRSQLETLRRLPQELQDNAAKLSTSVTALTAQRGAFTQEGNRWLNAFNGSKTELLGALEGNQDSLEEARRWLQRPRPIRLKAIELVEEGQGEED